jgi:hypothetical protein
MNKEFLSENMNGIYHVRDVVVGENTMDLNNGIRVCLSVMESSI